MPDPAFPLDDAALALFARKGCEGGPGVPQAGEANAVKVRRILQATADLARRPLSELRILDLGCGEGVYAIEAGLRGAKVVAVDGRRERMDAGAACAERHGLGNVVFRHEDVRDLSRATHGEFDVVYALGILYHLDAPDVFEVLARVREMCAGWLLVDTLVAPGGAGVDHGGRRYAGTRVREHGDDDSPEVRRSRVLKSLDNPMSFRFTRASLVRALEDAGFSSVFECLAPAEPGKAADRVTLAAHRGDRTPVSTYPWVNGRSDEEIAARLRDAAGEEAPPAHDELGRWIERLFERPELLRMGHNQRAEDRNLGLGWLYYALGRILRPRHAVVIGSYRGFVPLLLGRALADNAEGGRVTFVDPSLVDDFWAEPRGVREHFRAFGLSNVSHVRATTQELVTSEAYRGMTDVGILFVDGFHSAEQARFDYEAFRERLAPRAVVLFHDSMVRRRSEIYGPERAYDVRVRDFVDSLKRDASLQVFDLPFGTGLTLVRRTDPESSEPLLEGREARP